MNFISLSTSNYPREAHGHGHVHSYLSTSTNECNYICVAWTYTQTTRAIAMIYYICVRVYTCCGDAWGSGDDIQESVLSAMWILKIKFRLSGLGTSTFTHVRSLKMKSTRTVCSALWAHVNIRFTLTAANCSFNSDGYQSQGFYVY